MDKILYLMSEIAAEMRALGDRMERRLNTPQCDFECAHCTKHLYFNDPIKVDEDEVTSILLEPEDSELIIAETFSQSNVDTDGVTTAFQNPVEIVKTEQPDYKNYSEPIDSSDIVPVKEESLLKEQEEACLPEKRKNLEPKVIQVHELADESKEEPNQQTVKPSKLNKNQCKICGKMFEFQCYLKRHEVTHSKSRTFKCNGCQKMFPHQWYVYRHESTCSAPFFTCDHCEEKFENPELCRVHLKKHSVELAVKNLKSVKKEATRKCPICEKKFKSSFSLKTHMAGHTDAKRLKCSDCHRTFRHINTFKAHARKGYCI